MEYPTITIQHTMEDLRKYNMFSIYKRNSIRKWIMLSAPMIGVGGLLTYFFMQSDQTLLLLSIFLLFYPAILFFMYRRQSDRIYNSNKMYQHAISLTFKEQSFVATSDTGSQEIEYEDIYRIYNTKSELVIYLSKASGTYILKEKYNETDIIKIIETLQETVPNKF